MTGTRSIQPPRRHRTNRRRFPWELLAGVVVFFGLSLYGLSQIQTESSAPRVGGVSTPSASSAPTGALPSSVPTSPVSGLRSDAQRALETWARPGTPYPQWWKELRPLLSPGAREAYAHTDPSRLPRLVFVGGPAVKSGPSTQTATVYFVTTGGIFGADMARPARHQRWLLLRILFPGQESTIS
ncbi:MAG: hypothetical protein JWO11_3066 [Nocardioides sp.]|nr:hypothetical protein [Nocardioides sp.]